MDDYEMHNFLRMTVVNRKAFFLWHWFALVSGWAIVECNGVILYYCGLAVQDHLSLVRFYCYVQETSKLNIRTHNMCI